MRTTAKALKQFVGGFNLPAYAENTGPEKTQLPYLTYPIVEPEWNQKASFYIQGYFRTTDYSPILEKADEIMGAIGEGIKLDMEHGYLVIYPETPFIQTMVSEDKNIRSFYLNLAINAYHMPGK